MWLPRIAKALGVLYFPTSKVPALSKRNPSPHVEELMDGVPNSLVVVSDMFYVHPQMDIWSNFDEDVFQMGGSTTN